MGKEKVGRIERVACTHIDYHVQWKFAIYGARSSNQVFFDNLERWDKIGGGREIKEGGDTCIPMSDSC